MMRLSLLLPDLTQALVLAGTLGVALALSVIGAAVGGRQRWGEADLMRGWGFAVVVTSAVGVFTDWGFRDVSVGLAAVAVAAGVYVWRRDGRLLAPGVGRVLVLGAPLIVLVAAMQPSQWDEFTHWLVNGRYLLENDHFPGAGRAVSVSTHPAYPYALPLMMYWVGRATGTLAEQAPALFNTLALLSLAAALARQWALGVQGGGVARETGWAAAALGVLGMTALSPTFVPKVAFTAYADAPTFVAVTFLVLEGLGAVATLGAATGGRRSVRPWASMGLLGAALVLTKQADLVLVALAAGALGLVALRAHGWRAAPRLAVPLALAVALPVVASVVWGRYAAGFRGSADMVVRPFSQWMLPLLPKILHSMGDVARNKGGYFGLMLVLTVFGVRGLWRDRTAFDRLAAVVAVLFWGYNGFLLFCYVTAFSDYEAEHAASFWRYNMHLGPVAVFAAVAGLAGWAATRRLPARAGLWGGRAAVAVVLAMPLAAAPMLRFDATRPKQFLRAVAPQLAAAVPAGAAVTLLDPISDGAYTVMLRYLLQPYGVATPLTLDAFTPATVAAYHAQIDKTPTAFAFVHSQNPPLVETLGLDLPVGSAYLLERTETGWRVVRAWPFPGYLSPVEAKE